MTWRLALILRCAGQTLYLEDRKLLTISNKFTRWRTEIRSPEFRRPPFPDLDVP